MITNETWRSRSARDARRVLEDIAPRYGITRVADLTGLDWIGMPVAASFRPFSFTLSTSQGKSLSSLDGAIAGALMESIEVWHAERVVADIEKAPASSLSLPYDMNSLTNRLPQPDLGEYKLDWVSAIDTATGQETYLPLSFIKLDFRINSPHDMFAPMFFTNSSNGLAGGSDYYEAAIHALYEIVERDALSRTNAGLFQAIGIDRDEYHALLPSEVRARLADERVQLEVFAHPNPYRIPTFSAVLWTDDFNVSCMGSGSHLAPHVALGRAVSEAAQTRITHIAGARDDIDITDFDQVDRGYTMTAAENFDGSVEQVQWRDHPVPTDPERHLDALLGVIAESGSSLPVIASLTAPDDPFTVVKASIANTLFGIDKAYSGRMPLPAVARV